MKEKKKDFSDKRSEEFSKKYVDESPDKRHPNHYTRYKETRTPFKEMPLTGWAHHPHNEEILDGIPE